DCPQTRCDLDFFRRAVTFVDYVRDRNDAAVHVLLTEQATGGGGDAFTAVFIGRQAFAGREDTLRYFSPQDPTDSAEREGIAQMRRVGVLPCASRAPLAAELRASYEAPDDAFVRTDARRHPWNNSVFRVRGSGFVEG